MTNLFRNKYLIPSTRLPGYDYGQPGFYFVTICTQLRVHYFGRVVDGGMALNDDGKIVLNELLKTPQMRPNVTLDEFIIMPNHIHVIIVIDDVSLAPSASVETHCNASLHGKPNPYGEPDPYGEQPYRNKFGPQRNNLASIVRGFKSATTKQINQNHNRQFFAWQPRFYDHIIRDETAYFNIRQYIIDNPAMWNRDRNNPDGLLM